MEQQTNSPCEDSNNGWCILADFSLPSIAGNERDAMRRVVEAVEPLNLPVDRLDRLKTAVAEATMNATEHGNRYRKELPVTIRVMATERVMSVSVTDYGEGGALSPPVSPDIEAKMEGLQSLRGWGFFIIEKMVDEVQVESDQAHHTIQLYLYLEGNHKPEGNVSDS
jgi:serine/threonine-protein kinase RsbW